MPLAIQCVTKGMKMLCTVTDAFELLQHQWMFVFVIVVSSFIS
jgi:hypothetical protein